MAEEERELRITLYMGGGSREEIVKRLAHWEMRVKSLRTRAGSPESWSAEQHRSISMLQHGASELRWALALWDREGGLMPEQRKGYDGEASPAKLQVLFRSAVSGLWYEQPEAAGDIDQVKVGDDLFNIYDPLGRDHPGEDL